MPNSKTIAKNTVFLFVRMVLLMLINIIAVRYVRSGLGVESYGVLTAIFGFSQLASCLNVVLSSASQRYFSTAIGNNDSTYLTDCLRVSIRLSILLAGVCVLLFETVGMWFVIDRMQYSQTTTTVLVLYQFASLSFILTLLQVPFIALVLSRERMGVFAYISIAEGVLRLLSAIGIVWCPADRLLVYGALYTIISLLTLIAYGVYTYRHLAETRKAFFGAVSDQDLYRQMLTFSGWTMFGSVAGILLLQGNLLLFNTQRGPIVNAAFAVAIQIFQAFGTLSGNVAQAVRPPLISAYAQGNHMFVNRLLFLSSKAIYYLVLLVAVPIIILMPDVLQLWLGDIDPLTVKFSKHMIVLALLMGISHPITSVIQAAGCVKEYHLLVETCALMCLPVGYILLRMGLPESYVTLGAILCFVMAHGLRLIRLKQTHPSFSVRSYCTKFVLPAILITIAAFGITYPFSSISNHVLARFVITCLCSTFIIIILGWFVAIDKQERQVILSKLKS